MRFTNLFKEKLREVDIICRIGGDEFIVIFPNSSLVDVPLIRERLEEGLFQLKSQIEKNYQVQFSMEFSEYEPINSKSLDALITIADQDMYQKKNRKRKQDGNCK